MKIDHRIIITGIICLTIIYVSLVVYAHDGEFISALIIGIIALCIGVILPSPKINNRRGVLIW